MHNPTSYLLSLLPGSFRNASNSYTGQYIEDVVEGRVKQSIANVEYLTRPIFYCTNNLSVTDSSKQCLETEPLSVGNILLCILE